jgi:hypothetical protein
MPSVKNDLGNAVNTKKMPPFSGGSMLKLGSALGLTRPFSLRGLDDKLNGLPAATVIYQSGTQGPSTVTAWAEVGLQSDGLWSLRGSIHESGAIGHNYVSAVAFLDVKDAAGATVIFVHSGFVDGLEIGSRTDDFQSNGFSEIVRDHWDKIKSSHVEFQLHVSTDPWQSLEAVVLSLPFATVVVLAVIFAGDPKTKCSWGTDGEGNAAMICQQPEN